MHEKTNLFRISYFIILKQSNVEIVPESVNVSVSSSKVFGFFIFTHKCNLLIVVIYRPNRSFDVVAVKVKLMPSGTGSVTFFGHSK